MSVPKQALEQLEKAEKALQQEQQDTSPAEAVVNEETGNDEILSSHNEGTQEVSPQVDTEALQRELELERQRNASLKGRIESQLKQANTENKELKGSLESMQAKIEELEIANKAPGYKRHISEEEANELGEDVLNLQQRVIKGTIEEELERGRIKEIVEDLVNKKVPTQTQQVTSTVDYASFWNNVEHFYPGAREINSSDQGWFAFLELYDSRSGLKNRDVGADAINNGDVASLVDLLTAYKPIGSAANNSVTQTVKPETTAHARQVELPEQPTFTKAGVELFFKDVADGKFKGAKGRKEAEEIEAQIMEAAQNGRIL